MKTTTRHPYGIGVDGPEHGQGIDAPWLTAPRWYPRTVRFMRAVLRAGGSRLVSQRSKFRTLAICLHREGMLELVGYARGVAHYRATARGRAEFADSHQVGNAAG